MEGGGGREEEEGEGGGVYLYVSLLQPWPRPPVPLRTVLITMHSLEYENQPSVNSYYRKPLACNPFVERKAK